MKIWGEKNLYLTFMRARRSATEVSFSILGSLVPKVQLDNGYVFTTDDVTISLLSFSLQSSIFAFTLQSSIFAFSLLLNLKLCRVFGGTAGGRGCKREKPSRPSEGLKTQLGWFCNLLNVEGIFVDRQIHSITPFFTVRLD